MPGIFGIPWETVFLGAIIAVDVLVLVLFSIRNGKIAKERELKPCGYIWATLGLIISMNAIGWLVGHEMGLQVFRGASILALVFGLFAGYLSNAIADHYRREVHCKRQLVFSLVNIIFGLTLFATWVLWLFSNSKIFFWCILIVPASIILYAGWSQFKSITVEAGDKKHQERVKHVNTIAFVAACVLMAALLAMVIMTALTQEPFFEYIFWGKQA